MKDRVRGVLPALVDEAVHRFSVILDEAVVIDIAVSLHPRRRGSDVGPQPTDQLVVAGARRIAGGKHDEERRRIDAAIVFGERNLAEARHLTLARLMQDFAGLGVLRRQELCRLRRRQIVERAARELRIEP